MFSRTAARVVIADFQLNQDIIAIASGFDGLTLKDARDLLPNMSADAGGNAVFTIGADFILVLQHISLGNVKAHPADFFKLSG